MDIQDTPMQPINIFLRSSEYTYCNTQKNSLIFELNKPILPYPNMETLICVESFYFTNSFYTINENCCNFAYTYSSTIINKTLSFGNYDIDSLINYLNTALSPFVFTYSSITLTITITNSTAFNLSNVSNNIYELLGFDTIVIASSLSTSKISPYMFNLMTNQILHVCTPNIMLNSYGLKNTTKRNILGSIQVNCQPGETQSYTNNFKYKIGNDPITAIWINIYNQDFNTVNFNYIDWFINISFSFIYIKQLILPQYLTEYNENSNMQYYIEEEEQRNLDNYLDNIINESKKK